MDQRTLDRLKKALDDELASLEAEHAEQEAEDRESLSEASGENVYRDHMADQGSATFERELALSLEENLDTEIEEVRAALDRIAAGIYGVCESCGNEIPVDRLEAMPTAKLCISCKTVEENR